MAKEVKRYWKVLFEGRKVGTVSIIEGNSCYFSFNRHFPLNMTFYYCDRSDARAFVIRHRLKIENFTEEWA
jgi:hypothetical protein